MKNLLNEKQRSYALSLSRQVLLLTAGTCLSVYSHAVVTDMRINNLITQSIQTHPLVGSARANQEATTEGINAAKLNLLPTPSISSGFDIDNDFVTQVTIRQPLWTGGKLTADVNQAIFDDKAAVEYIYEQQNLVAKTTIDAWQGYIQAIAQQEIHREGLQQLNEFEEMMQRRVNQGVSARIELDLVTNRILQEQNAYQAAVEQQRIATARLEQIVGEPLSRGSAMSLPNIKTLVNQAKQQSTNFERMAFNQSSFYNPTVVKEHFQIESAKQGVEAQQASRYPTIYAQYEHAYYHDGRRDTDKKDKGKFSLGLNYAPGAGFSNLALARASQAQVNSLVQNQEAARRRVIEDVQVQYQQFVSAKDRENSLIAAVAGAQIVVSSYRRQFIAGRKSWLEVLNAVREHNDYQVQLVQTRASLLGAFHRLQVDFGVMPWQKFADNREPVSLFSPLDTVKEWFNKDDKSSVMTQTSQVSNELGYRSDSAEDYIEIRLPASTEEALNKGQYIMLNEDYSIAPNEDYNVTPIVDQENTINN